METLVVVLLVAFFGCLFWPKAQKSELKSVGEFKSAETKKDVPRSMEDIRALQAKECSNGDHDWREGWWDHNRGALAEGFSEHYMASNRRWRCAACGMEEFRESAPAPCAGDDHVWYEGWWDKRRGDSVTDFSGNSATFHYLYVCRRCGYEITRQRRAFY